MFDTLGIDSVTESVYRVMLQRKQDQIAEHLGLTDAQLERALDTLSKLALVRTSTNSDKQFHVVSPQIGLETLLSRQEAELANQQRRIEASRAAAAQLISEYDALRLMDDPCGVEFLTSIDQFHEHLSGFAAQAREEILALAPGSIRTQENIQASKLLNTDLLRRGVRMRTAHLDSIRNDRGSVEYAIWLTERVGEVRTVPLLPIRMIIMDRARVVISIDNEDCFQSATVLTDKGTIAALCALFELYWEAGQPLDKPPEPDGNGLTPQEQSTLALLAQGLTDVAIAARLGVSPRTARRIAAELMDKLSARSRFQAGVNAALKGWLPPNP